jgi:hypothetical protein
MDLTPLQIATRRHREADMLISGTEHPRDHYRELPEGVGGAAWIMLFAGITYVGLFIWLARLALERLV